MHASTSVGNLKNPVTINDCKKCNCIGILGCWQYPQTGEQYDVQCRQCSNRSPLFDTEPEAVQAWNESNPVKT